MRTLVLVDGEHVVPVVRAAIERLEATVPSATVVGAALIGPGEKLVDDDLEQLGTPVVGGDAGVDAVEEGLTRFEPELVVDLSDEPVLDARLRLRTAARVLVRGIPYLGADFRLDPPPRPRVATKPSVAVIGTGKRTGKTAVAAHVARLLAARDTPPVIVAMGRGGPPTPELVDPETFDLTPAGLLALTEQGRHAASDHLEDAVMARVATVGTRRCGGGLAGAPFDSTFAAGVALANARPEPMLVLEGSGAAIPPVHADATICVVPATADPELVSGYLGPYRVLLSDLIVVTMAEPSFADSGAGVLEMGVRGLAPGVGVVRTVFRPFPLEPISDRRVFFVTTAPASAKDVLTEHLECELGGKVVGMSHCLSDRQELAAELDAMPDADVLLVELKAAAVDLVVRAGLERGIEVTFCDNRVVSTGGDGTFEELALATADTAIHRFRGQQEAK
ncbi:MAG: 2,3-diphosphoglycerate synthetase [Actinomycetota bacterium]|nr:2,3-diphosphoglycerate synthetase [Actinomycetota bacterium]